MRNPISNPLPVLFEHLIALTLVGIFLQNSATAMPPKKDKERPSSNTSRLLEEQNRVDRYQLKSRDDAKREQNRLTVDFFLRAQPADEPEIELHALILESLTASEMVSNPQEFDSFTKKILKNTHFSSIIPKVSEKLFQYFASSGTQTFTEQDQLEMMNKIKHLIQSNSGLSPHFKKIFQQLRLKHEQALKAEASRDEHRQKVQDYLSLNSFISRKQYESLLEPEKITQMMKVVEIPDFERLTAIEESQQTLKNPGKDHPGYASFLELFQQRKSYEELKKFKRVLQNLRRSGHDVTRSCNLNKYKIKLENLNNQITNEDLMFFSDAKHIYYTLKEYLETPLTEDKIITSEAPLNPTTETVTEPVTASVPPTPRLLPCAPHTTVPSLEELIALIHLPMNSVRIEMEKLSACIKIEGIPSISDPSVPDAYWTELTARIQSLSQNPRLGTDDSHRSAIRKSLHLFGPAFTLNYLNACALHNSNMKAVLKETKLDSEGFSDGPSPEILDETTEIAAGGAGRSLSETIEAIKVDSELVQEFMQKNSALQSFIQNRNEKFLKDGTAIETLCFALNRTLGQTRFRFVWSSKGFHITDLAVARITLTDSFVPTHTNHDGRNDGLHPACFEKLRALFMQAGVIRAES